MTSRERFLKTLAGENPDRVPVTLFIADQGHFVNQMYPDIDSRDFTALQLKVIELQKQFGCDVFVRLLYGINDPLNIIYGGLDVSRETETWKVETREVQNGNTRIERSLITTPEGELTQDFSINEVRPGTFMYSCTKHPIESEKDLDIARKYEPKMPDYWPAQTAERIKPVRDALGDDGILGTWSPHGPFNVASLLINLDTLYSMFLTDYPFYEKLMEFALERSFPYLEAIDAAGVDVHCVGGNVPGGFLGRRMYEEYILPFEKRYIDKVQAKGTPAMYHNCGEIMNLVESYKKLGVASVEPFSPPPLGDADHEAARKIVDGEYVMLCGVDQVNVLQNGTVDEVKRVTEKIVKTCKPGGKIIIQSADFLEYGTPPENVEAFVETALEHSEY